MSHTTIYAGSVAIGDVIRGEAWPAEIAMRVEAVEKVVLLDKYVYFIFDVEVRDVARFSIERTRYTAGGDESFVLMSRQAKPAAAIS